MPKKDLCFPHRISAAETNLGFVEAEVVLPEGWVGKPHPTRVVLHDLGKGLLAVKVRRPPGLPEAGLVEYMIWQTHARRWMPPPVSLEDLVTRFGLSSNGRPKGRPATGTS